MEFSNKPKNPQYRIWILLGCVLAVLAAYLFVMFNLQIVHGADYRSQSVTQIVRSTTVEAARGDITDRNGKLMVGNRQTYTLTFDSSLLPEDTDQNAAILRLVNLCIDHHIEYTDRIPITKTEPYTYIEVSKTQQKHFDRFLDESLKPYLEKQLKKRASQIDAAKNDKKGKTQPPEPDAFFDDPALDIENLTASQTIESMKHYFKIDPQLSAADARKIMAVRWELALRQTYATTAYVLADDIDINFITLIKDGDYLGAEIALASTRQYETAAAAHILGYVGDINPEQYAELKDKGYSINATIGQDGVESAFENYLHGTNGKRISNVNDEGKVTSELYTQPPKPGDTVELTIDLELQEATERLLANKIEEITRKDGVQRGGAAAVIEIGTGDVLTLASYPTYGLTDFTKHYTEYSKDPGNPLFNRATMGLYAPGSILKPLTAIAALESGVTNINETLYDTGKWVYPGYSSSYARCWYRPGHGRVDVRESIKVSCNYYFAEMGYRMGLEKLNEYISAFGLGQHTGIEIGDYAGTLASEKEGEDQAPWAAFGQANQSYTILQLANYIATLAGGGEYYQPHLLKSVRSFDNAELIYEANPQPDHTIDIDPKHLNAVLAGMHDLATEGNVSQHFKNCVVEAGCKTGSVQTGRKIADGTFVAFAPYDDPQIAVAVVIEKANAGAVLASTAVEVLNTCFTEDQIATTIISENQLLG